MISPFCVLHHAAEGTAQLHWLQQTPSECALLDYAGY